MTTEEKARAYDEAIEKARIFKEQLIEINKKDFVDEMEYIFPEIKESEDERIRKEIIELVKFYYGSSLAHKHTVSKDEMIAWLEKQDGQKPIDKSKPKFNVGDWIIFDENHNSIYQVERIDNYRYYLRHYLGGTLSVHFDNELIRQWTIEDAKDGDVLSDGTTIFIVNDLLSDGSVMSYCDYDTDSDESVAFCPSSVNLMCSKIIPATKEQRGLLFQKIKEEGYEWDAEKKELNLLITNGGDFKTESCEQKPTWSIECEQNLNAALSYIDDEYLRRWLKDAIYNKYKKSVWSEEDECYMSECIGAIATKDVWSFEDKRKRKHWLESLKQRMEE